MKNTSFLKRKFFSLLSVTAISGSLVFVSCEAENNDMDDNMYTVSGNASGSQEVPAVSTTAAGTLTGTYNSNTNQLQYTINWNGLSGLITAAHFHGPASAGVNAGPIHDIVIGTNAVTGSTSATITVADSTEQHLLNGKVYYNLHTAANTGGEIRGQVMLTEN
jgi:hypothetical protein